MNKKASLFFFLLFVLTGIGGGLVLYGGGKAVREGAVSVVDGRTSTEPSGIFTQAGKSETQSAGTQEQFSQERPPAEDTRRDAVVKRTVDGDTLVVLVGSREEKVRLIGINSPESVDPRRPVECYGKEASRKMDELVTGHKVTMAADPENDNRDKYGRLLRYVFLEDGTFVNAWMIEHGYAFAYTRFPFAHMAEFTELEKTAREHEVGLWNSAVCPYYSNK